MVGTSPCWRRSVTAASVSWGDFERGSTVAASLVLASGAYGTGSEGVVRLLPAGAEGLPVVIASGGAEATPGPGTRRRSR
jgi:hypothetical protein